MKTTKLVAVLGVATFATAILGTTMVQAAPATTEGSVEFIDNDEETGTVDPEIQPPTPVEPPEGGDGTEEVDGPDGNSKMYVFANFDFGTHKVPTGKGVSYSAIQTQDAKWTAGVDEEGEPAPIGSGLNGVLPQFIQLKADKGSGDLEIKAELAPFYLNGTVGAKTLDITEIAFTNVTAKQNTTTGSAFVNPVSNFVLKPKTKPEESTEKTLATFTGNDEEGSINSLIFGEMEEENKADTGEDTNVYYNNGVKLVIPQASNMKAGEKYQANLTWTLSATAQP